MTVNSKNIVKKFTPFFEKRGFTFLSTPHSSYPSVYYKFIVDKYLLMYGYTISNLNNGRFTFSICLLPTFEMGLSLPELAGTTKRISAFLNSEERMKYLPEEFHGAKVVDGWWYDLEDLTVTNIEVAIEKAESRFLESDITEIIEKNEDLKSRVATINNCIDIAKTSKIPVNSKDELFLEIIKVNFEKYIGSKLNPKSINYFAIITQHYYNLIYIK